MQPAPPGAAAAAERIGAGEDGEIREAGDIACMLSISPELSLMPTTMPGKASSSRAIRSMAIGDLGDLRDVVEDDTQAVVADALDDPGIEAEQPLVADALVVEGRQHDAGLHAGADGVAGQRDRVGDIRCARCRAGAARARCRPRSRPRASARRWAMLKELASPVVPSRAMPSQPSSRSARQCAAKAARSGCRRRAPAWRRRE